MSHRSLTRYLFPLAVPFLFGGPVAADDKGVYQMERTYTYSILAVKNCTVAHRRNKRALKDAAGAHCENSHGGTLREDVYTSLSCKVNKTGSNPSSIRISGKLTYRCA